LSLKGKTDRCTNNNSFMKKQLLAKINITKNLFMLGNLT
jgi:hypothetical protein